MAAASKKKLVPLIVGGVAVPAGTPVSLCLTSACRDPRRYPDPDRFDVRRDDARSPAFGAGIHYCLGANLARADVDRTAIEGIAYTAGPGLAGALVQAITAPVVILLDACSYFISGVLIWRIRGAEPTPAAARTRILGGDGAGLCAHPPELWGAERAWQVVSLDGSSHVDLDCLEITEARQWMIMKAMDDMVTPGGAKLAPEGATGSAITGIDWEYYKAQYLTFQENLLKAQVATNEVEEPTEDADAVVFGGGG